MIDDREPDASSPTVHELVSTPAVDRDLHVWDAACRR
jgi:hypothetical protein